MSDTRAMKRSAALLRQGAGNREQAAQLLDSAADEIAGLQARDAKWIEFALAVGKPVGCLASTFPDANDHVLRNIARLQAQRDELLESLEEMAEFFCPFAMGSETNRADALRKASAAIEKVTKETSI